MRTEQVFVVPYNLLWIQSFNQIREELESALGTLAVAIEHVGSTSVEGLSAKPIIDIDIVIRDESVLPKTIEALSAIGYIHEGDLGISGREAFAHEGKEHLMKHHLYVCPSDSLELRRHLAFRDYLRTHPEAAKEYGEIKEQAAKLFPHDIERYIAYKSAFIERIYREMV